MWVFYVPVPKGKGKEIARGLLEAGVCRCVNIVGSRSLYEWKGKLKEQDEEIMIVKTTDSKGVEERIRQLHPYQIPAILRIEVEASDDYEEWLKTG